MTCEHRGDEDQASASMSCAPTLPPAWREQLAAVRRQGYPNSPKHQWAYRNFVHACFPDHAETTDPEIRDQIDWWWVVIVLARDGMWQYWLTVHGES